MTEPAAAATFIGLVDLVAAEFGGRALGASDEFFAEAENMLKPGRGVFIPDKFTENGKWMDGWETRRKRGEGHDWCILALGVPGRILTFDIDTNFFSGNYPHYASVEGVVAPKGTSLEALAKLEWTEILAQAPLRPTAQNLFSAADIGPVTHLRLNIFPDGGVARFRAYGRVAPDWVPPQLDEASRGHVGAELVDLAALVNGGLTLACSDSHFGPMNNILLPSRAPNMGGGWETRRNRGPGHDWLLIQLGARGRPQVIEIDTNHFKGNFPDRCAIEVLDAPGARITELLRSDDWHTILPQTKLRAHTRHFFDDLTSPPIASHLRLNIYPDGGVSRLRIWGRRES